MDLSLSPDLERRARRRAGAKLGFFIHAGVYLAVNLVLGTAAFAAGRNWAIYPALGWAVGLAIHGAVVYLVTGGIHERLVQRERERLAQERDPW